MPASWPWLMLYAGAGIVLLFLVCFLLQLGFLLAGKRMFRPEN